MKFPFDYYIESDTPYQAHYYIDDKDINEPHSYIRSKYYHRLDGPALEYPLHPDCNMYYIHGKLVGVGGNNDNQTVLNKPKLSTEEFIRLVKLKVFL